jgi:hypothetical protein
MVTTCADATVSPALYGAGVPAGGRVGRACMDSTVYRMAL